MNLHDTPSPDFDVVVVGARCAGSTAATVLARAGRRVLLVDRDELPSDTLSTHQLFPESLDLLDRLDVGDRLRATHTLHPVHYSWRVLGHAVVGGFTPSGEHAHTVSIRRVALDAALLATATAAEVEVLLGTGVESLLGAGTEEDPVRGVRLTDGREVTATWVVGADGRTSTVARQLGLEKQDERRGDMAMMVGYWTGMPPTGLCQLDVQEQYAIMSSPCEDDIHLISVSGPPSLTSGGAEERQEAYLSAIRRFPGVVNPRLLASAEQVSAVLPVPETMLRGFRRQPNGPGWVLVGDALSFKHPATAQGIGDALAQGWYVGERLADGEDLGGYADWCTERDAGHYDWSFDAGKFPTPAAAPVYAGLAEDPAAGQEFLDTFNKGVAPRDVLSAERLARWFTAATYEAGISELVRLLEPLGEADFATAVPACPGWTVGDLVGHLIGVAEDSVAGQFFEGALDAWSDPDLAESREAWTAAHVERRAREDREVLLRDLEKRGTELVTALRRGHNPVPGAPAWGPGSPVTDLAAHLADLREALGLTPDATGPLARFGFQVYRDWFGLRLKRAGLPALAVSIGKREWVLGAGDPAGSVTADPYEFFRLLSGRRSLAAIRALPWTTDPEPYLAVISPYPLPD